MFFSIVILRIRGWILGMEGGGFIFNGEFSMVVIRLVFSVREVLKVILFRSLSGGEVEIELLYSLILYI